MLLLLLFFMIRSDRGGKGKINEGFMWGSGGVGVSGGLVCPHHSSFMDSIITFMIN